MKVWSVLFDTQVEALLVRRKEMGMFHERADNFDAQMQNQVAFESGSQIQPISVFDNDIEAWDIRGVKANPSAYLD